MSLQLEHHLLRARGQPLDPRPDKQDRDQADPHGGPCQVGRPFLRCARRVQPLLWLLVVPHEPVQRGRLCYVSPRLRGDGRERRRDDLYHSVLHWRRHVRRVPLSAGWHTQLQGLPEDDRVHCSSRPNGKYFFVYYVFMIVFSVRADLTVI